MLLPIFRRLLLAALVLVVTSPFAVSGDGFPPFGAWAYGTGGARLPVNRVVVSPYGHRGLHGHLHRGWGGVRHPGIYGVNRYRYVSRYAFPSYRSTFIGHAGHFGFGSSFVYSTRVRSVYYAPPVVWPTWSSTWFAPAVSPVWVAPICSVPICSVPAYSAPAYGVSTYSVAKPAIGVRTAATVASSNGGGTFVGDTSFEDRGGGVIALPRDNRDSKTSPVVLVSGQSDGGQVVRQSIGSEHVPTIPPSVLDAADAIFRAGGYREAATAYAQIATRYGMTNALFTRRFVAQVAAGDVEQAAVIAASAKLDGHNIQAADLPRGTLAGLGLTSRAIEQSTELLAAHAFHNASDALPLEAVGRWLELAGDLQRSALFLARAAELESQSSQRLELVDSKAKMTPSIFE